MHAESNAITKLARSVESGEGSTMFCTHAPCVECAKLIIQSGITEVHFETEYRNNDGLQLLKKARVKTNKICSIIDRETK
jgi:dCMP deaminase